MLGIEATEEGRTAMHTDPVCGMSVEAATAAAAWEHDGKTYYFCSVGCMERFRLDPVSFLSMDPSDRSM
jgi:Cu+-exporting ATPase